MGQLGAFPPIAVVTGASSGVGLELTRRFTENGFDLILPAAADALGLATYAGVEDLCTRIRAAGRPVEALALHGGVDLNGDFASETDLKEELLVIDLYVKANVHLLKRVLPDMLARRQGRVLFTAPVDGVVPPAYEAVYAASSAFVLAFAAALRRELRASGVTLTTLVYDPRSEDAAAVARKGFDALMEGKEHVAVSAIERRRASPPQALRSRA